MHNLKFYLNAFMYIVIIFLLLSVCGIEIYKAFQPHSTPTYKFEVTGVISEANATTAASLHFECIKYCSYHEQYPESCFKACQTIGQEGCPNAKE